MIKGGIIVNYQTALFVILFAAMDISLALASYFEVKGNEKAAKLWSSTFYTVIFLNIFRGFLEYENIPDNIFKTTIVSSIILIVGIFVWKHVYRLRKSIREEIKDKSNVNIEGEANISGKDMIEYAVKKHKNEIAANREEWGFIRFIIIAGVIFFVIMFGAYYLSHHVLIR